jgi:hypothetical protein
LEPHQKRQRIEVESCTQEDVDSQTVRLQCSAIISHYCKGRRPLGYVDRESQLPQRLGPACVLFAELEAASIVAFEELAE